MQSELVSTHDRNLDVAEILEKLHTLLDIIQTHAEFRASAGRQRFLERDDGLEAVAMMQVLLRGLNFMCDHQAAFVESEAVVESVERPTVGVHRRRHGYLEAQLFGQETPVVLLLLKPALKDPREFCLIDARA